MKKSLFFLSHSTGNENLCVFYALDRGEKARKEGFIKIVLLFSHTLTEWCRVGVRRRRTEKCQSYDSVLTMVEKEGRAMDIWTNVLVVVAMAELCHFGRCV
jgi:hypothetical protein